MFRGVRTPLVPLTSYAPAALELLTLILASFCPCFLLLVLLVL